MIGPARDQRRVRRRYRQGHRRAAHRPSARCRPPGARRAVVRPDRAVQREDQPGHRHLSAPGHQLHRGCQERPRHARPPRRQLPRGLRGRGRVRLHAVRLGVDRGGRRDARDRLAARVPHRLRLPAGLARDACAGRGDPRVDRRHVRRAAGDGVQHEHADPVRARARDRDRR